MRRLIVLLAAAAAACLASSAAGASSGPVLTEAGGATFPDRLYVLSLPKNMDLSPDKVRILESGNPVADVDVVPAVAAGRADFGVVLVIDASNSMKGRPIAGAMAAARAFLKERSANAPAAVIVFNRSTHVLQRFTTDSAMLTSRLAATPALAEGTHIYDAVDSALDLVADSGVAAASVIVMSDGADTGSKIGVRKVSRDARDAHVRIFTIGLRSKAFAPEPLRAMASATQGEYAQASNPAALSQIYKNLGVRLAREYLIHYRSLALPATKTHVIVSVAGLRETASSSYTTPPLPIVPAQPYKASRVDEILQARGTAFGVAVFTAALIAFGLFALLKTPGRGVRARVGQFVSLGVRREGTRSGGVPDRVFAGAERSLEKTRWWAQFKELVELAEVRMPPVQIVLWAVAGAFLVGWIFEQIAGAPLFAVFGLIVPLAIYEYISIRVGRKRRLFADQLPDNLQVIASALRAGHSLVGAMSVVVEDAPEPTKSEFRRVIADERLGVPLEDALEVVVHRMDSRELAQVALVAALQRRTGGNSAEVLDRVTDVIRERAEIRRLVRTLTAQGRMARWVLTGLPVSLIVIISLVNPSYVSPLLHTSGGRLALFIAALMALIGSFAIKKIVNIKV